MMFLMLATPALAAERLRVAVVDTGLNITDPRFKGSICEGLAMDLTETGLNDVIGHGTHTASTILREAGGASPKWCLFPIKFYIPTGIPSRNIVRETMAVAYAIESGAKIVNISAGGDVPNPYEFYLMANHPEVKFVVAAGNDNGNAKDFYPCGYSLKLDNVVCVGALDEAGDGKEQHSNTAYWLVWEIGENVFGWLPNGKSARWSGTSMACAVHSGKLIHHWLHTR